MITSIEKLRHYLRKQGVELGRDELAKVESFLSEVKKWSKKTTIVSKRIDDRRLLGLTFDSLIVVSEIEGKRVADLGSGGGFPGIPLAIVLPEKDFTLVEIVRKKCIFLEYISALLKLQNVTVMCMSWDDLDEKFDTVVSMGTGYERIFNVTERILKSGGKFIYITSKDEGCSRRVRNPFIDADTCLIVSRETINR